MSTKTIKKLVLPKHHYETVEGINPHLHKEILLTMMRMVAVKGRMMYWEIFWVIMMMMILDWIIYYRVFLMILIIIIIRRRRKRRLQLLGAVAG